MKKNLIWLLSGSFCALCALVISVVPALVAHGGMVPSVPQDFTATPSGSSVTLSWSAPADFGGDVHVDYDIVVYDSRDSLVYTTNTTRLSQSVNDLSAGSYSAEVRANNSNGASDPATTTFTIASTVPDKPSDLNYNGTLILTENTLELTWAPPTEGSPAVNAYQLLIENVTTLSSSTILIPSDQYSYTASSLEDGTYQITLTALNADLDASEPATISVTLDQAVGTPINISNVVITPAENGTSATISWTTDIAGSSKVTYGPGKVLSGVFVSDGDQVTNHSLTITDLFPCTVYSISVQSTSAVESTSDTYTDDFVTNNCTASSSISYYAYKEIVFENLTDTILLENDRTLGTVTVDQPVAETESLIFQMKKLSINDTSSFERPADKYFAVSDIYDLKAYADEATIVENFTNPVTLSLDFVPSELDPSVDIDTLSIWHSEDGGVTWDSLSDCSREYSLGDDSGTVTCTTTSFSIFAIMGDSIPNNSSPTTSSGGALRARLALADANTNLITRIINTVYEPFMNNLWFGTRSGDVLRLQILLNRLGIFVAETGAGSPGNETEYFGPKTRDAVKRLQDTHKAEILDPAGLSHSTGFFGPHTRAFLNSILKKEAGME